MPTVPIGVAGPSYKTTDALIVSPQVTINYYPQVIEQIINGVSRVSELRLVPTPGLSSYVNLTGSVTGPVRGLLNYNEGSELISVIGPHVYSTDTTPTTTFRGVVANDDLPVRMVANVSGQVMILSAGSAYILDSGVVTQITDPDLLTSPLDIEFLDTYFIALRDRLQQFQISSSNEGTTWSALEFTTLEAGENKQMAVLCDRLEAWFFGTKKTLIYYNSGNIDFPFDRRSGGVIELGCMATRSPRRVNKSNIWLAADENGVGYFVKASGYQPQRISNHALETELRSYPRIDDCVSFVQCDRGHWFYWAWFPTANKTWVYDEGNNLWHQRAFWDTTGPIAQQRAHRASCATTFNNKLIVGDRENPILYIMDPWTYTDNGSKIQRERICPHIMRGNRSSEYLEYLAVRLIAQTGVGLPVASTADGYDPQISLSWSDDGGNTWSDEIPVSMGKLGEYSTIMEWRNLGSTNIARTFKFKCMDITPYQLVEAFADVQ